jgi:hypothetical protein
MRSMGASIKIYDWCCFTRWTQKLCVLLNIPRKISLQLLHCSDSESGVSQWLLYTWIAMVLPWQALLLQWTQKRAGPAGHQSSFWPITKPLSHLQVKSNKQRLTMSNWSSSGWMDQIHVMHSGWINHTHVESTKHRLDWSNACWIHQVQVEWIMHTFQLRLNQLYISWKNQTQVGLIQYVSGLLSPGWMDQIHVEWVMHMSELSNSGWINHTHVESTKHRLNWSNTCWIHQVQVEWIRYMLNGSCTLSNLGWINCTSVEKTKLRLDWSNMCQVYW